MRIHVWIDPDQNMSTGKWTIPDLIDFEYFLSSTDASMDQQDRRLFKRNIFDYRLPEQIVAGDDLFQEIRSK